jgi:hypothetical protein
MHSSTVFWKRSFIWNNHLGSLIRIYLVLYASLIRSSMGWNKPLGRGTLALAPSFWTWFFYFKSWYIVVHLQCWSSANLSSHLCWWNYCGQFICFCCWCSSKWLALRLCAKRSWATQVFSRHWIFWRVQVWRIASLWVLHFFLMRSSRWRVVIFCLRLMLQVFAVLWVPSNIWHLRVLTSPFRWIGSANSFMLPHHSTGLRLNGFFNTCMALECIFIGVLPCCSVRSLMLTGQVMLMIDGSLVALLFFLDQIWLHGVLGSRWRFLVPVPKLSTKL